MNKKIIFLITIVSILALVAMGCASNASKDSNTISIGYFPNITHAPAMIGLEKGFFAEELEGYEIQTHTFSGGSLFMDAMATGQIDIGYVGPGPALNRFVQGAKVTILAGTSDGGVMIVANPDSGIATLEDLSNKVVATHSLGCTHDLILRQALAPLGMNMQQAGGTVVHRSQNPSAVRGLFAQNQIDASSIPEPWGTMLEAEGAVVVKDWDELPFNGRTPATVIVTSQKFIEQNPEAVEQFLKAHVRSIEYIETNTQDSLEAINKVINDITQQDIDVDILARSLERSPMTYEINMESMDAMAVISEESGVTTSSNISGLIDLSILERVLANR
ncbi:aliphatic sulfonate ABC transporter substrate-binding protein [Desulfuribacillus alkaliarsenatis]|uniref:Aliphatic sulfonate ABC transporter substrate-binding protein n=1 Tax=Desulfuribacillus alkaliarsenatis TaxID=766136 RepID=A0A1E5G4Y8_9FIRM|nr:aliphatic sulfonate ABC transporter substrate-binding protein [Desulfuribacillus alkaliarsenatis]OEF98252.1 hypothetical protein BHF68_00775 [Desulfuribacillus alkaliarsenatis]